MSYLDPEVLQQEAEEAWSRLEGEKLKMKDRLAIPMQEMPTQEPAARCENMHEVALGYSEEQALLEASRCLQCPTAPCIKGCPVEINIPKFIKEISERDYDASLATIKETSLLPAICGRVCPQENQCQLYCTVGKSLKDVGRSVSIGRLERYVADRGRYRTNQSLPTLPQETGKRVAVIGGGPASITAAADLRRAGHQVTLFEAFHKAGGVLVYGIPEFRLPKEIVEQEIRTLEAMGVEIRTNFLVGRTRKLKDLLEKDGYDAAFIGVGAGLPRLMHIEGENLIGVFAANEFLTRSNLMKAYDKEEADTPMYDVRKVAVLGGGNVAMDAARTALRLGAEEVSVIYRRTRNEMPARVEEVEHAEEEGVRFHFLKSPSRILGDEEQRVRGIELLDYELGEPDESGRRRPIVIPGSESTVDLDTVIVSIGNDSNPLLGKSTPELELDKRGRIVTDEEGRTSIGNVFAGGDIVLGAATVILAMGEGRKAAEAMNRYLAGE